MQQRPQEKPPSETPPYGKAEPSCGTLRGHVVYSSHASGQSSGANGETTVIDKGTCSGANVPCPDVGA